MVGRENACPWQQIIEHGGYYPGNQRRRDEDENEDEDAGMNPSAPEF